ncbi:MAG: nuclear transport factor 2 family protein [Pseudomonadota bacterium]
MPVDEPDPKALVTGYLAAMEARDLATASSVLDDGFEMVFPGTGPMTSLTELVDWANGRYRFVRKTSHAAEVLDGEDVTVVYVRGVLRGEWPDGHPFEGIRFIDRFEVSGGLITRQDVWNDLAEVRAG